MIRYMTGFEEYSTGHGTYLTRASASVRFIISSSGRHGGKALTNTAGSSNIIYQFTDLYSPDFIVGFAYKFDQAGKGSRIFSMFYDNIDDDDNVTPQAEFSIYKSSKEVLQLTAKFVGDIHNYYYDLNGVHTVPIGTGQPLLPGRFYYIEWSLTLPSSYSIKNAHQSPQSEIRVNGHTVNLVESNSLSTVSPTYFDFSLRDYLYLIPDGATGIPSGRLKRGMRFRTDDAGLTQWWDDFYFIDNQVVRDVIITDSSGHPTDHYADDNIITYISGRTYGPIDFLGDLKVSYLPVDSAQSGSHNDWKIIGTDKYIAVTDLDPDGDSSYIYTKSVNTQQTYKFANLASSVEQIIGIGVVAESKTQSISSARQFFFVSGTSEGLVIDDDIYQFNTGPYLADGYTYPKFRFWHRDVTNGEVWTVDAINTFEAGLKGI